MSEKRYFVSSARASGIRALENKMKYAQSTISKIDAARRDGAEIVENKNWRYADRRDGFSRVVKLAQTNDRMHGYPKRIIWACYKG